MTRSKGLIFMGTGALAVWLASWLPAVSFWWEFQQRIGANPATTGMGALFRIRSCEASPAVNPGRPGTEVSNRLDGEGPGWGGIPFRGVFIPLPPGNLQRITEGSGCLMAEYDGATCVATGFPPGFIKDLFNAERTKVGGCATGSGAADDLDGLLRASAATPSDFRLAMGGPARADYAAAVLTKVLLWKLPTSEGLPESVRLETFRSARPGVGGAVLRFPDGGQAISIVPEGIFVFTLTGRIPAAWVEAPLQWGEIHPCGPEPLSAWRRDVALRFPPSHPLRAWAEAGAGETPPARP